MKQTKLKTVGNINTFLFYYVSQNAMPQGKKVAIGFQSYDFTRIASVRVADMFLAEAAFP